jgi:lipopolysaccharide transport system ATP-binding protein
MSSDFAIKVEGLSKCYHIYDKPHDRLRQMFARGKRQFYREFWALRDVSFKVAKGEAVGIIGRNGSGKSTLLQLICGTLNPTEGQVQTNGRIAALLELGSGFNPEFTGRENVFMNGAVLGLTPDEVESRLADIEAFADIGEFINQPTKTYSSGMLVRLAFAVQVCVEPEILIVDEALAVGDALFQKRCFERMEKLRSNGTTLLFVSHDQESVRTLTNRAVFLHHGVVQCSGNSADVLLEYRKLLHEEETRALNEAAFRLRDKAAQVRANRESQLNEAASAVSQGPAPASTESAALAPTRTASLSFGDMDAEVLSVSVLNKQGEACSHFDPRDIIKVVIECVAHKDLDHLNVGLRVRNKEGVKIYSWGTLNQDMAILAGLMEGEVFWNRTFVAGQHIFVELEFVAGLGPNLYEIQATVTSEGKPYYAEQRMLHWMDEAAFFTVTTDPRTYHFGGVVDLRMSSHLLGADL